MDGQKGWECGIVVKIGGIERHSRRTHGPKSLVLGTSLEFISPPCLASYQQCAASEQSRGPAPDGLLVVDDAIHGKGGIRFDWAVTGAKAKPFLQTLHEEVH